MLNKSNVEKILKRYLKTKVSLDEKTIVRILITGTLAFSLSACGGGGGGSSASANIPVYDEVRIEKENEGYEIIGKNIRVSGTIVGDSTSKNLVGIVAKNSNVDNQAEVNLAGEGSIGIKGTMDGRRNTYTIKNNNKISLTGKNSMGMYVENGVVAENNGTIIGTGEGKYQQKEDGTLIENSFGTKGIVAINNSRGINNKEIIMNGAYTTGMYADKNSSIENNGKISLTSKLVRESEVNEGNYYDAEVYSSEKGMRADNNSIATNNGTILGNGQIVGIDVTGASQGVNNGTIELESLVQSENNVIFSGGYYEVIQKQVLSKVKGMRGRDDGTVVTNNKNINLLGNAVGIEIDRKATGINNGNINLSSVEIETEGYSKSPEPDGVVNENWEYLEKGKTYSNLVGMSGKNSSEIVNNEKGNIILNGTGVGMEVSKNSSAVNKGTITVEAGKESWLPSVVITSQEEQLKYDWAPIVGMSGNESEIKNSGIINVLNNGTGIKGENNSNILNAGTISIQSNPTEKIGSVDNIGISLENGSIGENTGNIIINSKNGMTSQIENIGVLLADKTSSFINNGKIEIDTLDEYIIGIASERENGGEKIQNNGVIRVNYLTSGEKQQVSALGIVAKRDIENNGIIEVRANGTRGVGIDSPSWGNIEEEFRREIINGIDGKIVVAGDIAKGIIADDNNTSGIVTIKNDGLVSVTGIMEGESELTRDSVSTGIQAFNYKENQKGSIINNGKIEAESIDEVRGIDSFGNDVENNGIINVSGKDAIGIKVLGENIKTIATNNGTINVDGQGAIGMYAGMNSTAINGEEGIINVGSLAQAGMVADGENAKIVNNGTINLEQREGLTEEKKQSIALQVKNGGTIENTGKINIVGDLDLTTGKNSSYVIGTTKEGDYGKISAKVANLDGNIVVSSNITKNGFKNEYTLQNVVDAEDIVLGDQFNFNSDSLLYDAVAKVDTWGNLDATLTRNEKTLVDFSNSETKEDAEIFGKYYNEKFYKKLSSDAQNVISAIDTSSKENIDSDLAEVKPTIYSNLPRQILDTNRFFKEQGREIKNSLGENSYNFMFIGDYEELENKGIVEGYTVKTSGFIGALDLTNDIYGTVGYSYNDINYKDNSSGNIQSIHLGINKILNYESFNINFGINGEYSFNEYNREIKLLDRNAKSEFNSYAVGFTSEISRVFGKENYLNPYLGLDVTYLNYESFKEKDAESLNVLMNSQDYLSILPKVGINIGNSFNNIKIFVNVEYSYELGNMNKSQNYTYEGFDGKANLVGDSLESSLLATKVGASYEGNNLILTGEIGREFGERENSFVTLSLGYKF